MALIKSINASYTTYAGSKNIRLNAPNRDDKAAFHVILSPHPFNFISVNMTLNQQYSNSMSPLVRNQYSFFFFFN